MKHLYRTLLACCVLSLLTASAHAEEDNTVTLSSALAKSRGVPLAQADEQVEKIFALIRTELKSGRTVEIKDFGRFSVTERKSPVRAVQPGAAPKPAKPPKKFPHFTSAEAFKSELNPQKG